MSLPISHVGGAKNDISTMVRGLDIPTLIYKGLYLTSTSLKLLPWLHEQLRLWQEQCYQGLSQEEIAIYQTINQKIVDNLFVFNGSK